MNQLMKAAVTAGLLLCAWGAQGATCQLAPGFHKDIYTMPIVSKNITAGDDLPNGTTLYKQDYEAASYQVTVRCDAYTEPYSPITKWEYSVNNLPKSSWAGIPYAGNVYESGVAGVGVVFQRSRNPLPYSQGFFPQPAVPGVAFNWTHLITRFGFDLIKIGKISPGVISGSRFPTVSVKLVTPFSTVETGLINFSGTITINAGTCKTPNVSVDLGKQDINNLPEASISGPVTTFNVGPLDCSTSYGTAPAGFAGYNDGSHDNVPYVANIMSISYSPGTAWIDSKNGVIGLTAGTDAATGAGIQIVNAATKAPIDLTSTTNMNFPLNGTINQFSLAARYVRTSGTIKPGKANGSLVYTINYK